MRILRSGGEFADRQIRFHGKKVLWGLGGCVAFCAVFFFVSHGLAGVIGMVAVFELFRTNYDEWEHWCLGMRGELAVTRELKPLPDDYVLLNDLFLPNGRGNIDHFLLGPNGLFVIETKNYSGNVKCDGDNWFFDGQKTKSLSWQAKRNALAVRKSLAMVFSAHSTRLPFVEAVLVFVKHKDRLDLHEPTLHVLKAEDLARFVLDYPSIKHGDGHPLRSRRRVSLSPELIRAIVHHIHSLQNRKQRVEKTFEDFIAADASVAESRWSF